VAQAFTSNTFARGPSVVDLSGVSGQITDINNQIISLSDLAGKAATDAGAAITAAQNAASLADGKAVVYYGADQPTGQTAKDINDLWLTDKGVVYRYNGTTWVIADDQRIATALTNAKNADDKASSKITTYYGGTMPTGTAFAMGDLWFDQVNGNTLYTWRGAQPWTRVQDTSIQTAQDRADLAVASAASADAKADGKVTTFLQTTAPVADADGDLWIDTDDKNKLYYWNGYAGAWPITNLVVNPRTKTTGSGWYASGGTGSYDATNLRDGHGTQLVTDTGGGSHKAGLSNAQNSFAVTAGETVGVRVDVMYDRAVSLRLYARWKNSTNADLDATLNAYPLAPAVAVPANTWVTLVGQGVAPDTTTTMEIMWGVASGAVAGAKLWSTNAVVTKLATGQVWTGPVVDGSMAPKVVWTGTADNSTSTYVPAWLVAQDQSIGDLSQVVGTKITTLWSDTQPPTTGRTEGDLWVNTTKVNGVALNTLYRFTGGVWVNIQDKAITDAQSKADTAYVSANGKNAVFHQLSTQTPPNTTDNPRKPGDLWFQTDPNKEVVLKWDAGGGGQWLPAYIGDGAISTLNVGKLTTGELTVDIQLTAGRFLTAAFGTPRVQIDSTGITAFKDTTTVPYFSLDKTGVVINGGIIRTAPTGARWEISSTLGTAAQATNLIRGWPGSPTGDSVPATFQVDFTPVDSFPNPNNPQLDTPWIGITTPRLGTQGGYGYINMYGARRDGTSLPYFQYMAPGGHSFTGTIKILDSGLTMELGHLTMGKIDSPQSRIIYFRKQTDDLSKYYESRSYLYGGQSTSGWSTVLYEGGNYVSRINLTPNADLQIGFSDSTTRAVPVTPGSSTKWMNWGYLNVTTNASGVGTIPHGLGATPRIVVCVHRSATGGTGTQYIVRPISGSYDTDNFQFIARTDAGAVAASTGVGVEFFVGT
jgi:hypothetical protein